MTAITVVVCTRNRANSLKRTIRSILNNTFSDYELVVVDQSNNNDSELLISDLKDPRIVYVKSQSIGLSRSRNDGILQSRTEIITFTDDDCICSEDWLAEIYQEFDSDEKLTGLYGKTLPYGDNIKGLLCDCVIDSDNELIVEKPIIPYNVLGHGNNMSFRKKAFVDNGLYLVNLGAGTSMKGGEDTEFLYRLLRKNYRLKYSPRPVVYHDKWLTAHDFIKQEANYLKPGIAVFFRYTLSCDMVAAGYVLKRGKEILEFFAHSVIKMHIREAWNARRLIGGYCSGIFAGVWLLFQKPPLFKIQ